MDERLEVTLVDIDAASATLLLVFGDGHECRFPLQDVRRNCPCAGCRSAREQGRPVAPDRPDSFSVRTARLHGAWALNITWNDGHEAGIYPWESMRRWCDDGEPSLTNEGPGRPAPTDR